MKQYITREDLDTLTIDQMEKLRYLWIPKVYDLVSTKYCIDAENDLYENIEFVVGKVEVEDDEVYTFRHVRSHCLVNLLDICSLSSFSDIGEDDNDEEEDESEEEKEEISPEEDYESDTDESLDEAAKPIRPFIFALEECLPMLTIGDMMEILVRSQKEEDNFSIKFDKNEYIISRETTSFDEVKDNIEGTELCDVLWQAILELL